MDRTRGRSGWKCLSRFERQAEVLRLWYLLTRGPGAVPIVPAFSVRTICYPDAVSRFSGIRRIKSSHKPPSCHPRRSFRHDPRETVISHSVGVRRCSKCCCLYPLTQSQMPICVPEDNILIERYTLTLSSRRRSLLSPHPATRTPASSTFKAILSRLPMTCKVEPTISSQTRPIHHSCYIDQIILKLIYFVQIYVIVQVNSATRRQ